MPAFMPHGGDPSASADETDGVLEAEWDDIEARSDEIRKKETLSAGKIGAQDDIASKLISYKEVEEWLRAMVVDPKVLQPLHDEDADDFNDVGCGCFGGHRRRCSDVPGLDKRLLQDRDLVLFLKMTHFDFNDVPHWRILRTMYLKLTRNKVCPTIGGHWEVLGFQNGDPRKDLNRSNGVLNVLHMFYFYAHYFDIFKAAYVLAQDPEQNFPLACVAINLTGIVMERLFGGQLSKLCNRGDPAGVFETTCRIFCGGLYYFCKQWRTQKRTILDTEKTFMEVKLLMLTRPRLLLLELAKGSDEKKAKKDASRFEFTDIEFGSARAQPQQAAGAAVRNTRAGAPSVPKRMREYEGGRQS